MAVEVKVERPMLAQVLYNISTQEEGRVLALRKEVVKIIEKYRKEDGAPPPTMQAIYDIMHERYIEKAAEAKRYKDVCKNS